MMINGTELGVREPLLHSKLTVPRTVSTLIPRPRLDDRLMDAMSGNMTLVCAPAGYGKTTLVSEWLLQQERQTAWVSLDVGDNQGSRFWRYITAAIAKAFPTYEGEVQPVLPLLHTEGYDQGLIVYLNMLDKLDQELILVLDDFHVIQNEILLASFAYFTDYLPKCFHVCLISRTEPAFSVARMEARQLASRLNA
jgi:LuxR family transcriptional regulator, maltose regulon positive regulatory protein